MSKLSHIVYVKQSEIDKTKWDDCIAESANGVIYATSNYLDHMARNWDALVMNDYETIMPLTWKTKWGITYLYQPPFTAQLGIFSRDKISELQIEGFLSQIRKQFKFAEIFLNHENALVGLKPHDNYVLSLNKTYEQIKQGYKADLKKNLKRAGQFELNYLIPTNLIEALRLHQQQYGTRTRHLGADDYTRLENLCQDLYSKGELILRSVDNNKNELLSIALLLKYKKRIYLLESTTTKEGRQLEANHFLLDTLIREFSENDLLLDFVGSDIPGIAHFYKNYGSELEPYPFFYLNRLPWPLRLFK